MLRSAPLLRRGALHRVRDTRDLLLACGSFSIPAVLKEKDEILALAHHRRHI
jgi:hypothetical protein